jgi:hypothetical protein
MEVRCDVEGEVVGNVPNLLKLSKASPILRRRFARDEKGRCRMGRKNIYGLSSSQLPHLSEYCDGEIWENARWDTAFSLPKSVLSPTDISHGVYA